MDKEHFDNEMKKIEVPKEDVFAAINQGMDKGKMKKGGSKKKTRRKLTAIISSVAVAVFLVSGLVFAPITNVFASVPIIGSIYEKLSLQIGKELMESDLITEVNQEATSNGVDVTVTSAYYDGNVMGITFKADGKNVSLDKLESDEGPETGYSFHLFDGDEQKQWSAAMTRLTKTDDGNIVAAIEFFNPNGDLPENYTLPLTFSYMAGVKGTWKFDVPVERIPFDTISADANDKSTYEDYALKMKSIIKGKATTLLEYDVALPEVGKGDEVRLMVYDDLGNQLGKNHANVLTSNLENGIVHKEVRELFTNKIADDASYLLIKPEIERYESDTVHTLDQETPVVISSNRFDYQITVNNVTEQKNKMVVDYTIQNVNTDAIKQDLIQNFADFIYIIDSDDVIHGATNEQDIDKMIGERVRSEQAKLIDKETLHFQSSFVIENSEKVSYKGFSLMIPFGSLASNDEDIKMDPIKIELN